MTGDLERYLRSLESRKSAPAAFNAPKTLYRVYTEDKASDETLSAMVARYFPGATIYRGIGLDSRTQDAAEHAVIIEIVTSEANALQRILDLAGDIRVRFEQISVLVTQQAVTTFEVVAV